MPETISHDPQGEIFITKLEAARRQINAAVKMVLTNADPLAIHTVTAAGYRILRDIKKQRGRSELADSWKAGLFVLAEEKITQKRSELPEIYNNSVIRDMVETVVQQIKSGIVTKPDDIDLVVSAENDHWKKFNAPANFLKHADTDSGSLLRESNVENKPALAAACRAYYHILGDLTPEMDAFLVYFCASDLRLGHPDWTPQMNESYRNTPDSIRRRNCLRYIRKIYLDRTRKP